MKDLLFEIGTEEIPARFMAASLEQMRTLATTALAGAELSYTELKVYGTPRRLTLLVEGCCEQQPDRALEVKGPAKKAAFDAAGAPSRALQGFCHSQGVTPADLTERELKGVAYLYAVKEQKGQAAVALLPQMLLDIVHGMNFPKPMRWGYEEMRFVRPIRWLVALWGTEVLPLTIAKVTAGRVTRGHRFLGSDHIELTEAAGYVQALLDNYVIVDQNERRQLCWQQIQAAAAAIEGVVKPDEELLDEVTYILEYPTALCGRFEEKYLQMPVEMIITPMREHQRYFPVYSRDGALLPNFIAVRNGRPEHLDIVTAGNEKVLTARLSDADFFWQEDCKQPLEANLPRLSAIVFHEKLGTLDKKVARIGQLAAIIGEKLAADAQQMTDISRTAMLAKCDLVSRAVFEFTELQGTMGKYYARVHGEREQVAMAIEEHYLPRNAGDVLPASMAGIAVALADRLDSLVGFFGVGMIPTGSQDPYALRRQATAIAQIIVRHKLSLSLTELIDLAYANYAGILTVDGAQTRADLQSFFRSRLDNILAEDGIAYDVVNAVLAGDCDDLYATYQKAQAIAEFREEPSFGELIVGFTRAANLVRKNATEIAQIKPELFSDPAEKDLYAGVLAAQKQVAEHMAGGCYTAALRDLGTLRPQVDAFFDAVMVMAEDAEVRANRLTLLAGLVALVDGIGNLTELCVK